VTDRDIERILERAASVADRVPRPILDRITRSIHSSLVPVQPLPATWTLTLVLLAVCSAVAFVGAARLGFLGFQALGLLERVTILPVLVALMYVTAREFVSYWIPASRHYLAPVALVVLVSATLLFVFAALFHDYHAERFLSAGVVCLSVGVAHAIPAACLAAWFLRRGLLVEVVSGAAMAGAFGGLSGVAVLELHCANLEAPHILLWHVGVVPASALAGALAGWAIIVRRGRAVTG